MKPTPKTAFSRSRDEDLVPAGNPVPAQKDAQHGSRQPPAAAVAYRLRERARQAGPGGLIVVTSSEGRAAETGRALEAFAPDVEVLVLPPWDCLPFDRASPSRASMGRRMSVMARLLERAGPSPVLVVSAEAAVQRVAPREVVLGCRFSIATGDRWDAEAFEAFARRAGYVLDDRVDEPGEVALMGHAIDIFPADGDVPVRLMLDEAGHIESMARYDPVTQRTEASLDRLEIGPATELVRDDDESHEVGRGEEHRLADRYEALETVFTLLPEAAIFVSPIARERIGLVLDGIEEAREARRLFGAEGAAMARHSLYLSAEEWSAAVAARQAIALSLDGIEPVPSIALETRPARALGHFVREQWTAGHSVLVTGGAGERKRIGAMLRRARVAAAILEEPQALEGLEPETVGMAGFDLDAGFIDHEEKLVVLAAPDLLGTRLYEGAALAAGALLDEPDLRVGDVVIHEDHGVGVLRALEQVEVGGERHDVVRLEYRDGAFELAPVEEFGRIWRYGAEEDAVGLDRLKGEGWNKRRAQLSAEIDAVAAELVRLAAKRAEQEARPIDAPGPAYRRLAARFPFSETADQNAAIGAVLADLQSGRPMRRLVCGDVGFGKTEVALRAAAAMALSGRQVAVVAPTTVLVRQHLLSFERRFAGTDIEIGHLSRLVSPAEARKVRQGLADGNIGIVVATQAIAGREVAFRDLGLLVIDEEQRFGAKLKAELSALAPGLHVLSMSATPIPRTLQSAMVGLQEVSVIATPPARRRPVRTLLSPFDAAAVRTALMRERRRGGQSFVVVPRIEDIAPMAARLKEIVPELAVVVAHGELPADEVDAAMVGFANSEGEVLLATNIIESGLDVPQANTMLIWHPERFGLSQLHQLRGRVGRGRQQGIVYLLTDPDEELPEATEARLKTLMAYDRLGAGLAISARDLDFRGAGDLIGEEQAGHARLIGTGLYQRLLGRAIRMARGEDVPPERLAEIRLEMSGAIPEDYVGEPVVRINLYARLLRMSTPEEIAGFAEELEDRFGEPPAEVERLLALTELQLLAGAQGISRIEAGPLAIALSFCTTADAERFGVPEGCALRDDRLILHEASEPGPDRLAAVRRLLHKEGA